MSEAKWFYVNSNDLWVDEGEEKRDYEHALLNVAELESVRYDPKEKRKKARKHSLTLFTKEDTNCFEFKDEAAARAYYAKLRELVPSLPEL